MYKDIEGRDDDAVERWVGWCVFANNLVFIARALRRKGRDGNGRATQGQSDPAAA